VIRTAWITDAGVTAGTTVDRSSRYSRRQRQGMSGGRFPGMRRRPLSGDMSATPGAKQPGLKSQAHILKRAWAA